MLPGQQLSGEQKEELKTAVRITAVSDGSCVFNSFILALIHGIKQNPSYFNEKNEVFENGFLKFLGEYIRNQELKEDAHLYRRTQLDQKAADEFDKKLAPFPDIKSIPITWETFKAYLENKDSQHLQEVLALPLRKYTAQRMLSDQKLKDYLLNKELKQLFDTVTSVRYSREKKEKENQALNTIQVFVREELGSSSKDIELFLATFQPRKDLSSFKEYIRDLKDINEINEPLKGLLFQKCRIDPDNFLLSSESDLGSVRCVMVKLNELYKQGKDFSAVTTWWNTSGYKEYALESATSYQWGALAQLKTLQEIWRVKIECRLGQGAIIDLDEKKITICTLKVSSDSRRERIKAECIRMLKREKGVISWHDDQFTQFTWNENVVSSKEILNDKFLIDPSIKDLVFSVLITERFDLPEIEKVTREILEEMSSQWVPLAPDPYIDIPVFQLIHKDKQHWDAILTMSMVDYVLVELLKLKVIPEIVLQTESNIYSEDYYAIRENPAVLKLKKDLMTYDDIKSLCDLIKTNNDKKNTVEKDYIAVQKHISALGITPTVLDEKIYEVQQKRFEKKDGLATLYVEKIYDSKSLPPYVKQSHLETWIKYLIDTKKEQKVVNLLQGDFLTRLVSGPTGQDFLIKLYQNVQTPQIIKEKIKSIYLLYNSNSEIHIEDPVAATPDDKVNLLINKILPAEFQYLIDFSPLFPKKAFLVSLINNGIYELDNLQKDLIDAIKGKKIAKLIEINKELNLLHQVHIKIILDSQRISPQKKEEKSDPAKEYEEKIKALFNRIEVIKKEAKFSDEEKLNLIRKINPHLLEAANDLLLLKYDNPLQEIIQQIEYCITTPNSSSFDQTLLQVTLQSKSVHLNNIYHEVLALRTTYQSQKAIQDEQRKLQQKDEEKKKQEAVAIEKFNTEIIRLSEQVIIDIQSSLSSKVDYKDCKFDAKKYSQIYEELLKKIHRPQLEQLVESEKIKKARLISDVIIEAFDPQFSLDDISKKLRLAKTIPLVIDINQINSQVLVVRERQKKEQEELRLREKEAEERRVREESEKKREEKKREEDRRKVEAELKKTVTIKEIVNLTIAKLVSDEKPLKLIMSQLQRYEAEFTHMAQAQYRDKENNQLTANVIAEQVQTEMQGTNSAEDIQKTLGLQSNTGLAAFIRQQADIIENERELKKVEEAKLNEEKRKAEVIKQAELKKTTAINTTVDLIISKIISDSKSQLVSDQLQTYRKELTMMAEARYIPDQNNQEIANTIAQLVHKEILGNNSANLIANNLGLSSDEEFAEFIHQQAEKRLQEHIRYEEEEVLRQQEIKLSQIVDQLILRIDKRCSELKDYESVAKHRKTITEIVRKKLTTTTIEELEKSTFIYALFSFKMQEDDASLAIIAGRLGLSNEHEFVKFIYDQNIKLRSKYIDRVIEDKKLVGSVRLGLQTRLNEDPHYQYPQLTESVVQNPIFLGVYKTLVKNYLKQNLYGVKTIDSVIQEAIKYSINEVYQYFNGTYDLRPLLDSAKSKEFATLIINLKEQITQAENDRLEREAAEAKAQEDLRIRQEEEKRKQDEEIKRQQEEARRKVEEEKLGELLASQCKTADYKPIGYNDEDLKLFDEKSTHTALVQLYQVYGDQTVTKVTQWFNPINNESIDVLLGATTNQILLKFGNDLLYQRKQKQISHAYKSTTLIIKEINKKIQDEYKLSQPNPYLNFLSVFYSELKQPLIEIFKNQTNLMPDDFIRELGTLINPDNGSDEKALTASLKVNLHIIEDSAHLVQLARSIHKLNAGARASQAKDKDATAEFIIQYIKQRLEEKTYGTNNFYQRMDLSTIKPYLISIIAPGLEINDIANEIASLLTIDHVREKPPYTVRPELQNHGFLKVIFELNQKARLPYLRQNLLEMKLPIQLDPEYYVGLKIGQLLINGLDDQDLMLLAGDKTKDELIAFMQQYINIELTNPEKINIKLEEQLPGSKYQTLKEKLKRNIFNINSTALMQKQGEENLNALIKKLKSMPTYKEIEDIEVKLKQNLDHVSIKQLQYYGILDKLLRHPNKYFEIAKNVTFEYKQDDPYAMAVGILVENIKHVNQKAFEIAQWRSEPILNDVLSELKMADLDGFYPSLFESFLNDSQVLIDMERLIYTIFDRDEKRRGDFVSPIDIISTILKPGLTEGSIAEELKRVPSTKDYVSLVQAAEALNWEALQLQKKAALLWENAVAEIEKIDTYKYYPDFKQELLSLKTNVKLLNYISRDEVDFSTLSQMLLEFMDFHKESKEESPISNIYDIVARNKKVALEIITNHAVFAIQDQMLAFSEFKYATFKPSEEDKAAILRLFKDQKLHPQELFDTLRQFVNPLLNDEKQLAESMQEQFENLDQYQCVQLARTFAKYNKSVYEQINIKVLAYANEFFSEFKGTPLEKLYNPLKQQISDDPKNIKYLADFFMNPPINGDKTKFIALLRSVVVPELSEDGLRKRLENYKIARPNKSKFRRLINESNDKAYVELVKVVTNAIKDIVKQEKFTLYFPDLKGLSRDRQFQHSLIILAKSQDLSDQSNIDRFFGFFKLEEKPVPIQISHDLLASGFLIHEQEERDKLSTVIAELNQKAYERQREAKQAVDAVINQLQDEFKQNPIMARLYPNLGVSLNAIKAELAKIILKKDPMTDADTLQADLQAYLELRKPTTDNPEFAILLTTIHDAAAKLLEDTNYKIASFTESTLATIPDFKDYYDDFIYLLSNNLLAKDALFLLVLERPVNGLAILKSLVTLNENDSKKDHKRIEDVLNAILTRPEDVTYRQALAEFITDRNAAARQRKAEDIVEKTIARLDGEFNGVGEREGLYPDLKAKLEAISDELIELVKHPVINCDIAKFYDHLMQNQRMGMGSSLPLFWPPSEELFSDDFIEQDRIRDSLDEKLSNRTRDTISRAIVDLNTTAQLRQTNAKKYVEKIFDQLKKDVANDSTRVRVYPGLDPFLVSIEKQLITLILKRTSAVPTDQLKDEMTKIVKDVYQKMVDSLIKWKEQTADPELEGLLKSQRENAQKLREDTISEVRAGILNLPSDFKEYKELYHDFTGELKNNQNAAEAFIQLALLCPNPVWYNLLKDLMKYDLDAKEDEARILVALQEKFTLPSRRIRDGDQTLCENLAAFIADRNAQARQRKAQIIADVIPDRIQERLDIGGNVFEGLYPNFAEIFKTPEVKSAIIALLTNQQGINCDLDAFIEFIFSQPGGQYLFLNPGKYSDDAKEILHELEKDEYLPGSANEDHRINLVAALKRLNAERVVLQSISALVDKITEFSYDLKDFNYFPFKNLYPTLKNTLEDKAHRELLIQLALSPAIDCNQDALVKFLWNTVFITPRVKTDDAVRAIADKLKDLKDEKDDKIDSKPIAHAFADLNDGAIRLNIGYGAAYFARFVNDADNLLFCKDSDGIGFASLYPDVIGDPTRFPGNIDQLFPDLVGTATHEEIINELAQILNHDRIYFNWRFFAEFLQNCLDPLKSNYDINQVFEATFGEEVPDCPKLKAYLEAKIYQPLPQNIARIKAEMIKDKLRFDIDAKIIDDDDAEILPAEIQTFLNRHLALQSIPAPPLPDVPTTPLTKALITALSYQAAKRDSKTVSDILLPFISYTDRTYQEEKQIIDLIRGQGLLNEPRHRNDLRILASAIAKLNKDLYNTHRARVVINPAINQLVLEMNDFNSVGAEFTLNYGVLYPRLEATLREPRVQEALITLSEHVADVKASLLACIDQDITNPDTIYERLTEEIDDVDAHTARDIRVISRKLAELNRQTHVVVASLPIILQNILDRHGELFPKDTLKVLLSHPDFVATLIHCAQKNPTMTANDIADVISSLFRPETTQIVILQNDLFDLEHQHNFHNRLEDLYSRRLCELIVNMDQIALDNLNTREEVKHVRIQTTARMFTRLVGKTIRTRDAEEAALDVLRGMPPITDPTDRAEVERMRAAIVAQMNKGTFKLPTNLALIREGSPKEMKPMVKVDPVVTGECKLLLPDQAKDYQITDGAAKDVEIGAQFVGGRLTVGVVKDNNQDLTKTLPTGEVMPSDKQLAIATSVIFLAIANAGNSATNPLYIWPIDAGNQSQEIRAKATILIAAVSDGAFHVVNRSGVNYTPSAAELAAARQFFDGYIKPFVVTPEDHKDMNDDIHALRDAEDRAQARMPEYKRQGYAEMLQHLGEEAENKGRIEAKDIAGPARRLLNNGG